MKGTRGQGFSTKPQNRPKRRGSPPQIFVPFFLPPFYLIPRFPAPRPLQPYSKLPNPRFKPPISSQLISLPLFFLFVAFFPLNLISKSYPLPLSPPLFSTFLESIIQNH